MAQTKKKDRAAALGLSMDEFVDMYTKLHQIRAF